MHIIKKETFEINYSANIFINIAIQCIEKLGWHYISSNHTTLIAKVTEEYEEKITINIVNNEATITSTSQRRLFTLKRTDPPGIGNFRTTLPIIEQEWASVAAEEKARRIKKLITGADQKQHLNIPPPAALQFFETTTFRNVKNRYAYDTSFYLHFATLYNQDPYLLQFECEDQLTFSACINSMNLLEEKLDGQIVLNIATFEKIITNPTISDSVRDITNNFEMQLEQVIFEELSPYDYSDHLQQLILRGGIFSSDQLLFGMDEAKVVTDKFVETLFDSRIEDFKIYYTYQSWSGWFYDMGYDMTYLIFDKGLGEFTLFAKSDGD